MKNVPKALFSCTYLFLAAKLMQKIDLAKRKYNYLMKTPALPVLLLKTFCIFVPKIYTIYL